jgi:hypothetical protein
VQFHTLVLSDKSGRGFNRFWNLSSVVQRRSERQKITAEQDGSAVNYQRSVKYILGRDVPKNPCSFSLQASVAHEIGLAE